MRPSNILRDLLAGNSVEVTVWSTSYRDAKARLPPSRGGVAQCAGWGAGVLGGRAPGFVHVSSNRPPPAHTAAVSGPVLFLDAGRASMFWWHIGGQSAMGRSDPIPLYDFTLLCIKCSSRYTWEIYSAFLPYQAAINLATFT